MSFAANEEAWRFPMAKTKAKAKTEKFELHGSGTDSATVVNIPPIRLLWRQL